METKSENAIKWINELLTTNEKQGTGQLGDQEKGFCCLGLGCYVLGVEYNWSLFNSRDFSDAVGLLSLEGEPTKYYVKGDNQEDIRLDYISSLNDNHKQSFNDIANHLIQYPEYYFEQKVAEDIKKELKPNEVTV